MSVFSFSAPFPVHSRILPSSPRSVMELAALFAGRQHDPVDQSPDRSRCRIAALLGVAPYARDSGTSSGSRHVRGGRRRPRDVVYMAALTAMNWNPDLRAFAERLRKAGKVHKVVIVAVMRKLIVLANVLLGQQRSWTEQSPVTAQEPVA